MNNDRLLVLELVKGNRIAFNKVYDLHYAWLYGYSLTLTRDKDIAKDIVQETMASLWTNRASLDSKKNLKNFLITLTKRNFIDHYRKHKRDLGLLEELTIEAFTDSALELDDTDFVEKKKILNQWIEELPPATKEVFTLNKFRGISYREIAELKNTSIKTVESHLYKAMKFLKKKTQRKI
ncbi:RNA polymerase sigma-70 factor [Flavobacteriaceae bacterium]|nr:RNA polymerase sigma-70 factor [Flavobacteriaceae bacterium]